LADEGSVEEVSNLWKSAGSLVTVMEATTHDYILAATSHLPHVVAAALALSAGDNGLFCGSGFRDTTRIAEGSPQVWSDIVRTNAPALKTALKNFCENLNELAVLVDSGDGEKLSNWFAAARVRFVTARDRLVTDLARHGWKLLPTQGSYFVMADLAASGIKMGDRDFCEAAVIDPGIAAIPLSAFMPDGQQTPFIRLCFAKSDAILDEGAARLNRARAMFAA
jgi:hypothetical protein